MQGTHIQEQGSWAKLSKRSECRGTRSHGANRALLGREPPLPVPPALKNKALPSEVCLFPSSPQTLPRKCGGLSAGQALPRPAPMLHITPTRGLPQDGGWRIPPARFPPCHFPCPRYKLTHRHKVPRNLLMALSLSLQVCAGYTPDLPLVILFLVAVPRRQSNTQTSPSMSHNGGGLLHFFFVVKLRCSAMSVSTELPCPDTYTQADRQTDRHTHAHENTHRNVSSL